LPMKGPRKRFSGEAKTKVALEAIKGYYTLSEIASQYGVHPNQVTQWKKQVLAALPDALEDQGVKSALDSYLVQAPAESALRTAVIQFVSNYK